MAVPFTRGVNGMGHEFFTRARFTGYQNRCLTGGYIINDLINNDKNTLSPVGEMSSHARSYSPDNREYSSNTYPNLRLALMSTLDDNGEQIAIGAEVGNVL